MGFPEHHYYQEQQSASQIEDASATEKPSAQSQDGQSLTEDYKLLLAREQAAKDDAERARQRLHDIFMQAPACICVTYGPEHRLELINPSFRQLYGNRPFHLHKTVRENWPELEGQAFFELLDQVYQTDTPFTRYAVPMSIARHNHSAHKEGFFDVTYQPSHNAQGKVDGVLIYIVEVTEQVRAHLRIKEVLQDQKEYYRLLFENNPLPAVVFNAKTLRFLDVNEAALTHYGYNREEFLQLTVLDIRPAEDRQMAEHIIAQLSPLQTHLRMIRHQKKDGSIIFVEITIHSFNHQQQQAWLAIIQDITERKQAEDVLKQSEAHLRFLAETIPQLVWTAEPDGTVDYYNQRWYDYTGTTIEQVQGNSWVSIIHPEEQQQTVMAWNHGVRTGEQYSVQYRLRAADGSYHWFLGRGLPLRSQEGTIIKWFGTCTDIDEQKVAEERKNEFIRMASHELKTPVTGLKGFTSVLKRRLKKFDDEHVLHYLERMDVQLNKLNRLIAELLDISKMQAGQLSFQQEPFDLVEVTHEMAEHLQSTTQTHELLIEGETSLPVIGDRDRIEQVLINLITNAIKYSPSTERILISLKQDNGSAIVSIQDFGIGIAEQHQQHIFERFYQVTEHEEKTYPGLGIGLYICHEIVQRHGGEIWVQSEKGQGSTFAFSLPLRRS